MSRQSESHLQPRNGQTLMVGIVCRISGCAQQKDLSLEDQEDNCREAARDVYSGASEFRVISTRGKGERLDRPELEDIERAYRSEEFDLFVFDDLSRLIRGGAATRLLGVGVDHGTRSICVDDGIDTADETWEEDALNACSENVAHNQRTSKRLKQKLMNRFKKHGQAVARPIAGYVVPNGATSYNDWRKGPTAEAWITEGAKLLRETGNCSAVADLFNRRNIPVGPYCRRKTWNGVNVRRFYGNTLLKGMPGRGFKHAVKHHESGRRKSVSNPKGPIYYPTPHLAFFEPADFDDLQAYLQDRNARYRRKGADGFDPRSRVPRKRTRFPGQFGYCWYCGRHYVWGGNGITDNLMCSGSRDWRCWNSVSFNGRLAVTNLVKRITAELYRLDDFEAQYRELVEAAMHADHSGVALRREKLRGEQVSLAEQTTNLQSAIMEYGPKPMFKDKLDEIEAWERRLNAEHRQLQRIVQKRLHVPASLEELRGMLEAEFVAGVQDSPEFGNLLRNIVPEFCVHVVRLCDGGHLLARARVKLTLDGVVPDAAQISGMSKILHREFTLDLFEPPQRERIREGSVRLAAQGLGPNAIAAQIVDKEGTSPTSTAVQNALALDRRMQQLNRATPYLLVQEPPEDYGKLRRHKNAKYHFAPLEGYIRHT